MTGYAAKLGFELRGAPPQDQISAFADRVAPKLGPVVTVLSTFLLALWAARKAAAGKALNGLAVGILVTVVAIALGRSFSLAALTAWLLTLGAGWLGGAAGSRSGPSSAA